jgi:hypothetical protein
VCVCVRERESACSPLRFGSEATAGARESEEGEVRPPLSALLWSKKRAASFLTTELRSTFPSRRLARAFTRAEQNLSLSAQTQQRAPRAPSFSKRKSSSWRPPPPLLPSPPKKGKRGQLSCLFFSSFFSFRVNKEAFASFFPLQKAETDLKCRR